LRFFVVVWIRNVFFWDVNSFKGKSGLDISRQHSFLIFKMWQVLEKKPIDPWSVPLLCFGAFTCYQSKVTGYLLEELLRSCASNATQHLSVIVTLQHSLVMSLQNNANMAAMVAWDDQSTSAVLVLMWIFLTNTVDLNKNIVYWQLQHYRL
jgi:uncharacterized membrane protein YjfL (UPF0719 family)